MRRLWYDLVFPLVLMQRLLQTFTMLTGFPLMGLLLLGTFGIGLIGLEPATRSLRLWVAGGMLLLSVLLGCLGIILLSVLLCTRRWKDAFYLLPDIAISLLPSVACVGILWSVGSD